MLTLTDTDSTSPVPITPATATIIVGSTFAYDPPSNLALTPIGGTIVFFGHTVHITGTHISWTAPVNIGGASGIIAYVVTINGVTYNVTHTALPGKGDAVTYLDVPASILLTWDWVSVTAVNANGVASPKAWVRNWLGGGVTGPIA